MDPGERHILEKVAGRLADSQELEDHNTAAGLTPRASAVLQELEKLSQLSRAFRSLRNAEPTEAEGTESRTTWGPLEIGPLIGTGAFGKTYAAYEPNLERDVALKLPAPDPNSMDPEEYLLRTLEEARRLAKVRHPNVVLVFGADSFDGQAGIWTELIRGESLESVLERKGTVPWTEVARIGVDAASALSAVHDAGLLHGDVKPANLMQEPGGRIVLIDFGSARRLWDLSATTVVTTPLYAAPELFSGSAPSVAADIYALGAILFRTLTGSTPLDATSMDEILERHQKQQYRSFDEFELDLPKPLRMCIEQALAPQPDQRYATAHEMLRALSVIVEKSVVQLHHNLPNPFHPFVGREKMLDSLLERVRNTSVTTLTGFGGVGKTRTALEVARRSLPAFPDGVWWIELASVGDRTGCTRRILDTLGIAEDAGETPDARLLRFLVNGKVLLLLDNCEQVAEECGQICRSLAKQPSETHILVTSRVPLGIEVEYVEQMPPLASPPMDMLGPSELLQNESVQLFLDRAARRGANWHPTEKNLAALGRICNKLEGVPLALELAAARTSMLSFEQISDRLEQRFAILASRAVPERAHHQSLLASLEWSYELLSEHERILYHRLSVFPASWSLESAEAVCGGEPFAADQVLELSTALMEKAFIESSRENSSSRRYRMLEVVREFASSLVEDPSESSQKHAEHFLALAEELGPRFSGSGAEALTQALEPDEANFFCAFDRFEKTGQTEFSMRLMAAMGIYWLGTAHISDAQSTYHELLERDVTDVDPLVVARTELVAASLDIRKCEYQSARDRSKRALDTFRTHGDKDGIAHALGRIGGVAARVGDYETADRHLNEALDLFEELESESLIVQILSALGILRKSQGRAEESCEFFDRAITLGNKNRDQTGVAQALIAKGGACWELGRKQEAKQIFEQVLAATTGSRDLVMRGIVLQNLAAASTGESEEYRRELFTEAIQIHRELGDRRSLGLALHDLGAMSDHPSTQDLEMVDEAIGLFQDLDLPSPLGIALLTLAEKTPSSDHEQAVRCLAAIQKLLDDSSAVITEATRSTIDVPVAEARASVGEIAFAAAWTEGASWDTNRVWTELMKLRGARADRSK